MYNYDKSHMYIFDRNFNLCRINKKKLEGETIKPKYLFFATMPQFRYHFSVNVYKNDKLYIYAGEALYLKSSQDHQANSKLYLSDLW